MLILRPESGLEAEAPLATGGEAGGGREILSWFIWSDILFLGWDSKEN